MIPPAALSSAVDVASLVPEAYAAHRRLVVDGLAYFFNHLTSARQSEILAAQAALPADSSAAVRLIHLMHFCPTLHKLGQVLARRRELDASLRTELQRLESMEPRTPVAEVRAIAERELGSAMQTHQITLGDAALAEASVAVVLPLTWRDPQQGPGARGVVKVLRPEVADRLQEELNILAGLADYFDHRRDELGLPNFAHRETFDDVRALLSHEICFEREQHHLDLAARRWGDRRDIWIPRRLPFCTPSLTAMERIDGCKITAADRSGGERLARQAAGALAADAVFARDDPGLFHADPHAGNLWTAPDGRLAILDWALVGRLTRHERACIARLVVAGLLLDASRMRLALEGLAARLPCAERLESALQASIAEVRGGGLPGPAWLMRLLQRNVTEGGRLSADMTLFYKMLVTLEGVLCDVSSSFSLDHYLIAEGVRRFAEEWPRRIWAPPASRDYQTPLSNLDLFDAFGSAGLILSRFWTQTWRQWLERRVPGA